LQHPDIRRKSGEQALAIGLQNVAKIASRQQIHNSGGVFVNDGQVDENGRELGTGTIINGAGGQFAPHVNDTTAPGVPTGVIASSAASMLIVAWNGTLTGGVPNDFSHLNVYVDDINVGSITSKGTSVFGPYQVGSEHIVRVSALDDAHNDKGESTPNESSKTSPVTVKIVGSDVDPSKLGISITKSTTDPTGTGLSKGDLWLKYDKDPNGPEPSLIAEWWWDGDKWVAIPVVVYLDQIAARDIHADSAVIGLLSAGIIQSGTFRTADSGARVEINSSGIREYDSANNVVVDMPSDGSGLKHVGSISTGLDGGNHAVLETRDTNIGRTGALTFLLNGGNPSGMPVVSGIGSTNGDKSRSLQMAIPPSSTDKALSCAISLYRDSMHTNAAISSEQVAINADKGIYVDDVRFDRRVNTNVSDVLTLASGAQDVTVNATRVAGMCFLQMTGDNGNKAGGHSIGTLKPEFLPAAANTILAPAYNWAIADFQSARLYPDRNGLIELWSSAVNQGGFGWMFIYPLLTPNA
jgi:hypothetical protein